jgi:hypothetical protein
METTQMYSSETAPETWKVRVLDRVYEADVQELKEWIDEGAVTAADLVQKGNLRWLAAGRVPELATLFATDADTAAASNDLADQLFFQLERNGFTEAELSALAAASLESDGSPTTARSADGRLTVVDIKHCAVHADRDTVFACNICNTPYCNECPNRFGSVRLCPSCGGICASYKDLIGDSAVRGALNKPYALKTAHETDLSQDHSSSKPGIRDLVDALKTRLHIRSI